MKGAERGGSIQTGPILYMNMQGKAWQGKGKVYAKAQICKFRR